MYATTGRVWPIPATERPALVRRLAAALRPVAEHAEASGVRLAIEPLNRYETSVLNTVAQALEVVEAVDSPACGLLLDTYHMNIEERDPAAAARGGIAPLPLPRVRERPWRPGRRPHRLAGARRRPGCDRVWGSRLHRELHRREPGNRQGRVDLASAGCVPGRDRDRGPALPALAARRPA